MIDFDYFEDIFNGRTMTVKELEEKSGVCRNRPYEIIKRRTASLFTLECILGALGYDLDITKHTKDFGKFIWDERSAQGLTVDDLANDANVTTAGLRKIEKGEVTPTLKTVNKLLNALGYELAIVKKGDAE